MNEENGLVDTVGQGVSGMNGEISINIYTLLCVKQTVIEKLLSLALCDEMGGNERGSRGRKCMYNYGSFTLLFEL